MLWLGQATFSSPELATKEAYAPNNTRDNHRSWNHTDGTSERESDVADNLPTHPQTKSLVKAVALQI